MNYLLLVLILSLFGCASFQDKHNCHLNTFKMRGNNYRYCSLKDPEKPFFGVTYGTSEDWLFEPAYTRIETFEEKKLFATIKGKGVVRYNFDTKKMDDTDYLSIEYANSGTGSSASHIMYVRYKNGTDIATLYSDGIPTYTKINNVDSAVRAPGGGWIDPVYYSLTGGLYVRHKEGNKKYYKMYNTISAPLSPEFPEEDVQIFQSYIWKHYHPMVRIDKEQDLYWILFRDNKTYFKKPDYLKGIIVFAETHHDTDNLKNFPTYEELGFVFNGENGKDDYMVIVRTSNDESKTDSLDHFKQLIEKARTNGTRYYDHSWSTGKVAGMRGKILDKKYYIFKGEDNKYFHRTAKGWSEGNFTSSKEAVADINRITLNVDKDVVIRIQEHMRSEAQNRATRQETAAMVNADIKRESDALAASKAEAEAARKAENAKVWGRVSDKIKGAADKAKTKADCVRKNTQTKKDYLDKKQGWYTTGGCD